MTRLGKRLALLWDDYLYQPFPSRALGRFRIAFYFCALAHEIYHYRLRYYVFPEFLFKPLGFFTVFPVPQPSLEVVQLLYALLAGCLILSALGCGRVFRIAAALLAIYVYGVRYNYGFNFKAEGGVSVMLTLMIFTPCDAALALRRRPDPHGEGLVNAGYFSWPIQFARAYWIYMLFTAGLFKLKYTGWKWAFGDSIHFVLLRQMYYFYPHPSPPTPLGHFMLQNTWLSYIGSWVTLLAELLAPLMFLRGPIRFLVLGNLIFMLVLVRFSMEHSFVIAHLPLYVSLLPWEGWARPPREPEVVYEGETVDVTS